MRVVIMFVAIALFKIAEAINPETMAIGDWAAVLVIWFIWAVILDLIDLIKKT